jgi:polar amino acid transport system substrate-binding protein
MNRAVRGLRYLFVLLLVVLLGPAVDMTTSKLGTFRSWEVEAANVPIRVGTTVGLVPWEYVDKTGKLTGFEVEMLREVGTRLKRPVQFIDVQEEAMFAGLLVGKYEILASALAILCERQKKADFSVPYYDSGLSAFVRKDDARINRVEDLKGMTVGVGGSGTSAQIWASRNKERYGIKEVKVYEDGASTFLDLEAGRIDAVVQSSPTGAYFIRDKPKIEMRVRGLTGAKTGLAFRKGDPLRAEIDDVLNAMKKDGAIARLHVQQIGYQPPSDGSAVNVIPRIPVPDGPCP